MRVIIWTAVIAVFCASIAFAADQTLTGAISDSMCGHSHRDMSTKMTDRECTESVAHVEHVLLLFSHEDHLTVRPKAKVETNILGMWHVASRSTFFPRTLSSLMAAAVRITPRLA